MIILTFMDIKYKNLLIRIKRGNITNKSTDMYCLSQFWTNREKNYEKISELSPPFLFSIFLSILKSFAFSILALLTARKTSGSPM